MADIDCETTRRDFGHTLHSFREAQSDMRCVIYPQSSQVCEYQILRNSLGLLDELGYFGFTEKSSEEASGRLGCLTSEQKEKAITMIAENLVKPIRPPYAEECTDCTVRHRLMADFDLYRCSKE